MEEASLKVLMISSDRNLFSKESQVRSRISEYGSLVGELHIVVLSLSSHNLVAEQIRENVWIYPTNSFSKWFYVHDAAKLGKKLISEKKFVRGLSLITAQDPFECGLAGLKIKNKWRLPLEIQLHTDPFSSYFTGFKNNLRKKIARKVIKNADSLRAVTESLKNKVSDMFNIERQKIFVLPIFIDRQKFENKEPAFDLHTKYGRRFLLLSVARLAPEKNLGLALKVLAIVNQKFPEVGLVIVGSGPEENNLKALAKKLGVEESVAFEGWQNDLYSYYRTANLFLQTSRYEGYGLSLIEAALSGLPILTTPVGVAMEFEHGKDLYICPPNNPEYWAEVVISFIENNQKRDLIQVNMKQALLGKLKTKEEFLTSMKGNWENISKKV
jgi:glycosyltransferase involved in cell wall biosynthesis